MTDADYTDDPALLANIPVQSKSLLHGLKQVVGGIGFYVNTNKTKFMCLKLQEVVISTLSDKLLKSVVLFPYLGSNISSSKSDVDIHIKKPWTAINRLSLLLYGCTTWTPTKCINEKLDGNHTRMLGATSSHTFQERRTRHAGHCWRSKPELVSDILLLTEIANQRGLIYISFVLTLDAVWKTCLNGRWERFRELCVISKIW